MIKTVVRTVSCVIIVVCAILGAYTVAFYSTDNDDLGIRMVCLLYEYDSTDEIAGRDETIASLCTPEVYNQLSPDNSEHFEATYGRIGNYETQVKIVFTRPGLIVYALDSAVTYPTDLWVFEYRIKDGLFSSVQEYKLVGTRTDSGGGLF